MLRLRGHTFYHSFAIRIELEFFNDLSLSAHLRVAASLMNEQTDQVALKMDTEENVKCIEKKCFCV